MNLAGKNVQNYIVSQHVGTGQKGIFGFMKKKKRMEMQVSPMIFAIFEIKPTKDSLAALLESCKLTQCSIH